MCVVGCYWATDSSSSFCTALLRRRHDLFSVRTGVSIFRCIEKAAGAIDLNVTLGQTPCRAVPPFTIARKEEEEEEEKKKAAPSGRTQSIFFPLRVLFLQHPVLFNITAHIRRDPDEMRLKRGGGWKLQ